MIITPDTLAKIARKPVNDNMRSTILGLQLHPGVLSNRLQLAMFLGQLAHESGGWHYDREVWGNTPAQQRYDTRADLGNTPERDGDGFRYRGRGPMQLTGKDAYSAFSDWARAQAMTATPPDFVANPDAVNLDPWEGLSAVFFWHWKPALAPAADRADVDRVTRIVNGGTNGLAERRVLTDRALQILADAQDLKVWQEMKGLTADGVIGPLTRGALVMDLRRLPPVTFQA